MFRMLVHSSSGACDCVCVYTALVQCVLVLRCGSAGVMYPHDVPIVRNNYLCDTSYLSLCVDDCLVCMVRTLCTRQSSIQNNKYQVSHRHSYFSWWWAHSCLKHVEKRNKHTKENCAPSWIYLQDYTGMHGQQNMKLFHIKFHYNLLNSITTY